MHQNKINEELLKTFESLDNEKLSENIISDETPDIVKFIIRTNIKQGDNKIQVRFLYKLFKTLYKTDMTQTGFCRLLTDFITVTNGIAFINLNEFQGLTPEQFHIEKQKRIIRRTRENLLVKHFNEFVQIFNLKPGNKAIPATFLLNSFNKWRRNKTKQAVPYKAFFLLLGKIIPKKSGKYGIYYSLDLNEETRKVIKEDEVEKYNQKKRQKANKAARNYQKRVRKQKKTGEIPSIESSDESQKPSRAE